MMEHNDSGWNAVFELGMTDPIIHAVLEAFRDEPREKQLIRMVCLLVEKNKEMIEEFTKKFTDGSLAVIKIDDGGQ